MTPADALAEIQRRAASMELDVDVSDPDQLTFTAGAVGGIAGLLDALQKSTSIEARKGGGWIVHTPDDVDGFGNVLSKGLDVVFDAGLTVTSIGIRS